MKERYQPDLSGRTRESVIRVRMPRNMNNAWRTICKAKGANPCEAIRDLVEREIRMHHQMDDAGPDLIPDDK